MTKLSFLHVWPLPSVLTLPERTELLQRFGAVEVQHVKRRGKQQAALAGFTSPADCRYAVSRLHQLELLGHRLQAMLWDDRGTFATSSGNSAEAASNASSTTATLERLQQYESQLTALSAQLGVTQPLPPHLRYTYPNPSPSIVANIANALVAVPKLYTQVLHLMNKMNLPPPFGVELQHTDIVKQATQYTKVLDASRDEPIGAIDTLDNQKPTNVVDIDDAKSITAERKSTNDGTFREQTFVCHLCKRTQENVLSAPAVGEQTEQPVGTEYREQIEITEAMELLTDSSTSESELESDDDTTIKDSHRSALSVEQRKSLKRPRALSSNPIVDVHKRAKMQLQRQKQLQSKDLPDRKCARKRKPASIRKVFKTTPNFGSPVKLQLILPSSVHTTAAGQSSDATTVLTSPATLTSAHNVKRTTEEPIIAQHDHKTIQMEGNVLNIRGSEEQTTHVSKLSTLEVDVQCDSGFGRLEVKKGDTSVPEVVSTKYISLKELEDNRVKESEYAVVPVLSKYSPGEPSSRLYIKNLSKSTTAAHLHHIYDRYAYLFYGDSPDKAVDINADQDRYHIRVMQEGRMKGQAFVTLPTVALAEQARRDTNGYILHDKPTVVCFARVKAS